MNSLVQFIFKYRSFFFFLVLELISLWLIFSSNPYQNAAFFNSSNGFVGRIYATKSGVTDYFDLLEGNKKLSQENAILRKLLYKKRQQEQFGPNKIVEDSTLFTKVKFIPAKVINNEVLSFNNYFTINKGSIDGVEKDMGVIGPNGIAGIVKSVSKNYATAYSLLHRNLIITSEIKRTGDLCSVKWNGGGSEISKLLYVPKHVLVQKGDTIVTSGLHQSFVEGIDIGVVENIQHKSNESFYDIEISLLEDFNNLKHVYFVKSINNQELDSLLTQE